MKVKNSTMQAFPFIEPQENENIKAYHPGMTMRDEFAKTAMLIFFQGPDDANDYLRSPEDIANWCYIMADAMMKARKS
jgi:hypothetical protein